MSDTKFRLRYAPSPTGYLHIGNTRTALMNYLFAKHYDGSFIVRIEDTDTSRNVEGAIESQFANLHWLGIKDDESILNPQKKYGPYQQSHKFDRYLEIANDLILMGVAYKCFCTPEELEQRYAAQEAQGIVSPKYDLKCFNLTPAEVMKKEDQGLLSSIRFHVPDKTFVLDDLVRGRVSFEGRDLGDFIIVKSNGIATYNFAVVVDDHDMKISHVVRGEEHISNTPRQLMLYEALEWDAPQFAHLTLIVDENHKKLSKRSGNALFFIEEYKKQGYIPEAIFNYIALLGWSPVGQEEIFSKTQLIKLFDEHRFSRSPSTFDPMKLKWINSQYMKKLSDQDYFKLVVPVIDQTRFNISLRDGDWVKKILLLFKNEIEFGLQINDHLDLFFNEMSLSGETQLQLAKLDNFDKLIKALVKELEALDEKKWTAPTLQKLIKDLGEKTKTKGKNLFMPIRIFATKAEHGPAIADTLELLGKQKVLENINSVYKQFSLTNEDLPIGEQHEQKPTPHQN